MLTAIRTSDNKKVYGNYIEKDYNAQYFCDYCKQPVIHHKSKSGIKIGHFKHKVNNSCPNKTNETEYHLRTKIDIYEQIKEKWDTKLDEIQIEKWICNNSIRADIFIKTSKNIIAIEVQATILTVDEIRRRTEKYYENGIYVLWVLPYDNDRIWKDVKHIRPDKSTFTKKLKSNKVKLKQMEIFLYWMYFKKLVFWDLEHLYSKSFIVISFTEYQSGDVDYRDESYVKVNYLQPITKTLKSVINIYNGIKFKDFSVETIKNEFKIPKFKYSLPKRKIFYYDDRKKQVTQAITNKG